MKKIKSILLYLFLINSTIGIGQTAQITIGSPGITETFSDTKFDPNDGGTISVGYLDSATGNTSDLFWVKLNSDHQIVWQKSISNEGDDILNRVIVCSNGDYAAAGQIYQDGIRRAFVCRINSSTGNIIWSKISSNSLLGELFWDLIETSGHNIALAGADSYSPSQTNSFIVLLNSNGGNIWSKISSAFLADEFRTINQLPNGNLIVGGFYNPTGNNYYLTIIEINENTETILDQNTYHISTRVPGNSFLLESLWPSNIFIKNSVVLFEMSAFQGFGSSPNQCIFTYDQTTKNLTGNIYDHDGAGDVTGNFLYPITENDFLLTASYANPTDVFVSRTINGTVAFDKKINSDVNVVSGMNVSDTNVTLAGNFLNSDLDAYNFFSSVNIPASSISCNISNSNTLILQAFTMNATSSNVISLSASSPMTDTVLAINSTAYSINNVCGLIVLPITLKNLEGYYNSTDKLISLNWSTASEFNNKLFIVERSADGQNFYYIGSIKAKGPGSIITTYNFIDPTPLIGKNFYRLKQVDMEDRFQYSDIATVLALSIKNSIIIMPNPAHGYINISSPGFMNKAINYHLIDAVGKTVRKGIFTATGQPVKIYLANIQRGLYWLKFIHEGIVINTQKLLVQ